MAESIVVIRLTRNLRYKLTYVKIFETYLESEPGPDVTELLKALIQAQQSAIVPLSRYLRRLDVKTHDLELDQKCFRIFRIAPYSCDRILAQDRPIVVGNSDLLSDLHIIPPYLIRKCDRWHVAILSVIHDGDRQARTDTHTAETAYALVQIRHVWKSGY